MRPIVLSTLLAVAVFGGSTSVFAQSVETYPDERYFYEENDKPTIRPLPVRPRSCGVIRLGT
jgi:hypothetical protein